MPQKLKCDFHMHTWEDPSDIIAYTAFELIEAAASKGYDVLSITNHRYSLYYSKLEKYAEKLGILLIPGVELTLREGHVILLFDDPSYPYHAFKTLDELHNKRPPSTAVIAPHPFFPINSSLGSALLASPECFDAVEYTMFYYKYINFNKKAEAFAKKHALCLLGVGDIHCLWQLDYTYTLIDTNKNATDIIKAIKEGRVELVTRPIPLNIDNIKGSIDFYRSD